MYTQHIRFSLQLNWSIRRDARMWARKNTPHAYIAFVCVLVASYTISRWLASVSNHIANRAAHQFVGAFVRSHIYIYLADRVQLKMCVALRCLAYAHIAIPKPIYSMPSCCVGCVFLKICVREATSKILNNFWLWLLLLLMLLSSSLLVFFVSLHNIFFCYFDLVCSYIKPKSFQFLLVNHTTCIQVRKWGFWSDLKYNFLKTSNHLRSIESPINFAMKYI